MEQNASKFEKARPKGDAHQQDFFPVEKGQGKCVFFCNLGGVRISAMTSLGFDVEVLHFCPKDKG